MAAADITRARYYLFARPPFLILNHRVDVIFVLAQNQARVLGQQVHAPGRDLVSIKLSLPNARRSRPPVA